MQHLILVHFRLKLLLNSIYIWDLFQNKLSYWTKRSTVKGEEEKEERGLKMGGTNYQNWLKSSSGRPKSTNKWEMDQLICEPWQQMMLQIWSEKGRGYFVWLSSTTTKHPQLVIRIWALQKAKMATGKNHNQCCIWPQHLYRFPKPLNHPAMNF